MRPDPKERLSFYIGIVTSLLCHVVLATIAILILENAAATATKPAEVFSVTIEGGMNLGGISQTPKEGAKKILTPDQTETEKPDPKSEPAEEPEKATPPQEEPKPEKQITEPSAIEEKKEQEKKAKQEKEKKAKEEKEKLKLKEKEEKEKKAEEKKKEDEAKKKERAARDKRLSDTLRRLKNQYEGESADAGGKKEFGAAALGGKGMGGGELASLEKIGYYNALKNHVKQGWHWLNSADKLVAKVEVSILPDGRIQNVNIVQKSGNANFDDSVVRAVFKASPVPPAPANLYQEFRDVVFTFDSAE